jgi:hypothetical protein
VQQNGHARLARNQREEITEVWFGQRPTFFLFFFLQQFFFEGMAFFFWLESFFLFFTGSLAQHKRVCGNEDRLRHIHLARIKAHYLGTLGVSLNSGPMRKKLSNVTTM